jgi:cell division septation protein DedD
MSSDARAFEAGDDGFHEIQLNGKQLVFLGMATTLVSVVIFLCGVLVGRGVKPLDTVAQAGGPQPFDAPAALVSTPSPAAAVPPGTVSAPAAPAAAAPAPATPAAKTDAPAGDTEPTPVGDEAEATPEPAAPPAPVAAAKPPVVEAAKPPVREAARPAPKPSVVTPAPAQAAATPAPRPAPAPAPAAAAASAPSTGGAIAVQVGAFKTRGEADGLARRLSGKGYAVYVMNPTGDGKNVYRVRVGNFSTADEAQRVSARLTDQEKLKPWITR